MPTSCATEPSLHGKGVRTGYQANLKNNSPIVCFRPVFLQGNEEMVDYEWFLLRISDSRYKLAYWNRRPCQWLGMHCLSPLKRGDLNVEINARIQIRIPRSAFAGSGAPTPLVVVEVRYPTTSTPNYFGVALILNYFFCSSWFDTPFVFYGRLI